MNIYSRIQASAAIGRKMFAVLIDPDKCKDEQLTRLLLLVKQVEPDFIFVGGSLTSETSDAVIDSIHQSCTIPAVLFPGSATQISLKADAMLFLSLISGRNPDFLIGQHVISAPFIKKAGIESISTGYMLIESGETTAVEYMSNTRAIPRAKNSIAVATAIAGELLGNKLIYLEAGSGAKQAVPAAMITDVKNSISVPLMVGGGLRTAEDIKQVLHAGADMVVVGNILEKNPDRIIELMKVVREAR